MFYFIELAARASNLPDSATPKEKAKAAVLALLRGASAEALASSIIKSDESSLKNIVSIVYPGKKARNRDFLMAQLIAALIKIADDEKPYTMQKVHNRRKVVGVLTAMVEKGEKFDWTKSAKAGFTISPANVGPSNKDAVDFFTGEVLQFLGKRLKTYDITPAAYRKLFGTPTARMTSVKLSQERKKKLTKGDQVPGAPNPKGDKKPHSEFVTKLRAIRSQFTKLSIKKEAMKDITGMFNSLITSAHSMTYIEIADEIEELLDAIFDVPVSKSVRADIEKITDKIAKLPSSISQGGTIEQRAKKTVEQASKAGSAT